MITIFGSTGRIGGAAAAELRRRGLDVRAAMRDPARGDALAVLGCELAAADLHEPGDVTRALDGADGVLVICPVQPAAGDLEADAARIIDAVGAALASARPRVAVAISDYGAHHASGTGITMIFHRLEERLRAAPTAMTFLRSAEHMQNWRRHLTAARTRGELPSLHHPVSREFPTVSAPDVGLIAAEILAESLAASPAALPSSPRVIHVEGPRRYSALDVAQVLGRLAERPVAARELPRESWMAALAAGGLGESYARLVTELQDAHNAGRIEVEPGGEVRRGSTELADALAMALAR
ncbi:MAG TPA: NmrA family NAD(P)-binding protein [Kofleriaceae bacterium]|nr:NmrA family NAD(P)-binding protein [Kofleriaceae bacterium]